MKLIFVIVFLFVLTNSVFAQAVSEISLPSGINYIDSDKEDSLTVPEIKHTVYLELLGTAGLYSVNYDMILNGRIALRSGVGYTFGNKGSFLGQIVYIPVSVSFLTPINNNAHFEAGLGGTAFYGDGTKEASIGIIAGFRRQDFLKKWSPFQDYFYPYVLFSR